MTELLVRNYWLSGPFFRQGGSVAAGAGGPTLPGSPAPTDPPAPGDPPAAPGGAADPGRAPAIGEPGSLTPGQTGDGTPTVEVLLQKHKEQEEELKLLRAQQGKMGREVGDMRLLKRQVAGETLTPAEIARVNDLRGIFTEPIPPGSPAAIPPAVPSVPGTAPPAPVAPDPKVAALEAELAGLRGQMSSMSQNLGNLAETTTDYHAEQRIAKNFTPEERTAYKPYVDAATAQVIAKTISMEELMLGYARSNNLPAIIANAEKRGAAAYAQTLQKKIDDGIPTSGGIQPTIPGASGDVKVVSAERLLRLTDPIAADALYGKEKTDKAPAAPPAT